MGPGLHTLRYLAYRGGCQSAPYWLGPAQAGLDLAT